MDNKKYEYKQIIRESLIKGGYLKKPSFEDKLDEIINDSFNNLDLLLKKQEDKDLEEYEEWDIEDINELSDEEIVEYEKCLPDYITSLPGSLRSTDPKELQGRLDAIDKRLGELDNEIDDEIAFQDFAQNEIEEAEKKKVEAQKNLDDYHEKEEQFLKDSEKSQGEALDHATEIRDAWDEFKEDWDVPQSLDILVRGLGDSFEHKGYLDGDEVGGFKDVADMLDDFANDVEAGGFDDDWEESSVSHVHELAQDIRDFADEYDINKSSQGDTLVELMGIAGRGEPSEWENTISDSDEIISRNQESYDDSVKIQERLEKERDDLEDNKTKTTDRLKWSERREDYNVA